MSLHDSSGTVYVMQNVHMYVCTHKDESREHSWERQIRNIQNGGANAVL